MANLRHFSPPKSGFKVLFALKESRVAKKLTDDVWRRSRDDEREEEEGWAERLVGFDRE